MDEIFDIFQSIKGYNGRLIQLFFPIWDGKVIVSFEVEIADSEQSVSYFLPFAILTEQNILSFGTN